MAKQTLNSEQAAEFLCISLSTLMKMCHRRQIRYYKSGRRNIFFKEELLMHLENNRVKTADELKEEIESKVINLKI